MGTRSKNFSISHSFFIKLLVFVIAVLCFTGIIHQIIKIDNADDFGIVLEKDYFHSQAFIRESEPVVSNLLSLLEEYKNEQHILAGNTISNEELMGQLGEPYDHFQMYSKNYNPQLSETENFEIFKRDHVEEVAEARNKLIQADLRYYYKLLKELAEVKNPYFYATDGENVFSNTKETNIQAFKSNPSYMIFEEYNTDFYPKDITENINLRWITDSLEDRNLERTTLYIAYSDTFLDKKSQEWQENKELVAKSLKILGAFAAGFIFALVYLFIVIGRTSFKDKTVRLNFVDRLYNDVKIVLFLIVFVLYVVAIEDFYYVIDKVIWPMTTPLAALGLVLILSLIKHIKNRTFFKHTLIYTVFHKLFSFFGDVYANGSVAVKTVLLVVGYPLLVVATFFIFPITLGFAAWLALKKIKTFKALQDGVEKIKEGDIYHRIEVNENGEFGKLADNINSITDGLKTAVDNELKSERMKTELITNVSHDIRTPLTSIITYVDLLKRETNHEKIEEYIEVLDQKAKRLKVLTDDLFEAAKASSGNIPVSLEKIDIISLVTQGLGEVNEKIEALNLDFKVNYPSEKVYVTADGKLLWRSIENLLSNIFKYALRGSRVYIDIEDCGNEVLLTCKNISAYELNISADELMERFKRGDESRSSQGSGLGLSIAKSLIENQRGRFTINIDGDLFKAMIYLPKHKEY